MKQLILIPLFIIFSISIFAQSANDTLKHNENITNVENIQNKTSQQLETYKVLYEDVKMNNDKLIDSFQWSIGSILLIIIAIFGSSIYLNFRFNKNELSNLLQKAELKIQEIKTELLKKQELEIEKLEITFNEKSKQIRVDFNELQNNTIKGIIEEIKEFKSKMDNSVQNIQEKSFNTINNLSADFLTKLENLSNKYQNQLDTFNENYKQQINTLNLNIGKQVDTINISTEKQIGSLKEILNTQVESLNKDFEKVNLSIKQKDEELKNIKKGIQEQLEELKKNYKRDVARTNALLWEHKGVFINSLRCHIEEFNLMLELNWSKLDFYLNEIIENLSKITSIDNYDYNIISKFIELLPTEYLECAKQIQELMEQKKK